jgi:hypothetical protein
MAAGSVELGGKVIDGGGAPKVGLTVSLYEAATWEAAGSTTATTTTDSDGLWAFSTQDITKVWLVVVTEGTKKYIIDARNELQLTNLDIITEMKVNTIYEHTSGSGVTIDGVLIKDGIVTAAGALLPSADDTHDLGSTSLAWQDLFLEGDITFTDAGNITFTPSTSDTVVLTASTNGAFSLVTTDAAAAAANIQITADGTVDIDSAGVLTLDSGAAINIEPASGSAILLDGTISIDAGVVTGATSITSENVTITSDIAVDGTANLDNTDIEGTLVVDGTNISLDSTATLNIDNSNTSNGITIGTATASVPITIGHGTGSTVTIGNDLTVAGDLLVSGDTITVNTATLAVEDPLIALATGNNSADALDIGIYGLYDTSGSLDLYAGLFRDADDSGKWKLFKDNQAAPTTTVNTSGTGYAVGTLVATLEGNVTGNVTGNASGTAATVTGGTQASITATANLVTVGTIGTGVWQGTDVGVAYGGTGVSTLTDDGLLIGSGTGVIRATDAGSAGEVMTSGGAGVAPDWAAASGGSMTSFQLEDDSGDEVAISNAKEVKFIGDGLTINWTDTDNGTDGDPYDLTFSVDAAQTGITSLGTQAADFKVGNGYGLVVGHTAQVATFNSEAAELQVLGTAGADSMLAVARFSNDGAAGEIVLGNSRAAGAAAHLSTPVIINDGDTAGVITGVVDDGVDMASRVGSMRFEVDGTPGANDTPGRIRFMTTADGAASPTERLRIDKTGQVFIGDTANASMTVGLTINQGAADNAILAFKSSDVNHGMTGQQETDTFASFKKSTGGSGGLRIQALGDADTGGNIRVLWFNPIAGSAPTTTDATTSVGVLHVQPQLKSGSNVADLGATDNAVTMSDGTNTRWLLKGNGDVHQTTDAHTALDSYEDAELIRAYETLRTPDSIIRDEWDDIVRYNEKDLQAAGILGSEGINGLTNTSQLQRLHSGAIWQSRAREAALESRIDTLEQRLLTAGV